MTRLVDSTNVTASQQMHVPYVLLADFDFVSGHLRLCSWDRPYSFGGNTYLAAGSLAGIGEVTEGNGINSEQLEFTISGVDNSVLTTVLAEKYHGRDAILYLGYLNPVTYDLAATPEILWEGFMDTMSIKTDVNVSTVRLVCENRLLLWNKASEWKYTDEHQRLINASDTFFNLVSSIVNKTITWAGQAANLGSLPKTFRPPISPPPKKQLP